MPEREVTLADVVSAINNLQRTTNEEMKKVATATAATNRQMRKMAADTQRILNCVNTDQPNQRRPSVASRAVNWLPNYSSAGLKPPNYNSQTNAKEVITFFVAFVAAQTLGAAGLYDPTKDEEKGTREMLKTISLVLSIVAVVGYFVLCVMQWLLEPGVFRSIVRRFRRDPPADHRDLDASMESFYTASGSDFGDVTIPDALPTTSADGNTTAVDGEPTETIPSYTDYDPSYFSPRFLYRPQNDVVGALIVHSSSEGAGRYELGRKIGINTKTKPGHRRVSQSIQLVTKHFPDHIGQYQKMEGKYRTIKYYFKASQPKTETAAKSRFKELTKRECPFKFGDVLKFPDVKLNTLRITDVTMKCFLYILQALEETPIILTSAKIINLIQTRDAEEGYQFRIDKRSAAKVLLALSQHGFCRMFTTEYEDEGIARSFEIVTAPIYANVEHPDVQKAIAEMAEGYVHQNKIFPTGTLRPMKRQDAALTAILAGCGLEAEEAESDDSLRRQNDMKHANHLREVLRTKNDLPVVSDKTLNSLAISYRRRRGLVASVKRAAAKSGSQPDAASGDEPSTSSAAAPTTPSQFFAANRDLAEVMAASSLTAIKDDLVNVLVGCPVTAPSSSSAKAEAVGTSTPSRRRKAAASGDDTTSAAETTPKKKKRPLDDVDINCLNQQLYMRNRFSAKERDMRYSARQAHVELAERMRKRDPGSAPRLGDRVPYVIVSKGKNVAAYEKAEDPIYVLQNSVPLDTDYYLHHQLEKPVVRLFDPVLDGRTESILFSGEHTRQKSVDQCNVGGLVGFTKKLAICLGCKAALRNVDEAEAPPICDHCKPQVGRIYTERVSTMKNVERRFARL